MAKLKANHKAGVFHNLASIICITVISVLKPLSALLKFMQRFSKAILIRFIIIIAAIFFLASDATAQNFGYRIANARKKVTVPFELYNNLIILPVLLNDSLPLKFILDTGIGTSILSEAIFAEMLNLKYDRSITITGPGTTNEVTAYMVSSVRLSLPGIECRGIPLYVLAEDYLKLQEYMGTDIHGILGGDIFNNLVIDIDYENKLITFIDPEKFKPSSKHRKVELEFKNSKPYMKAVVQSLKGENDTLSVLVDLGASHAILIDMGSRIAISLPEKTVFQSIGRGIAGMIPGYVGRLSLLEFAGYNFRNVITTFSYSYYPDYLLDTLKNGSVGGDILSRFRVVINYPGKALYLRPNRQMKDQFSFNMSGIEVVASGPNFKTFTISAVTEGSEAEAAGIKVGDEIIMLNGMKAENLNLNMINALLREKDNRRVNLKIKRNDKFLNIHFYLRNLI